MDRAGVMLAKVAMSHPTVLVLTVHDGDSDPAKAGLGKNRGRC